MKCLNNLTSASINTLISKYNPSRPLRSMNKNRLIESKVRSNIGSRSFHHASPQLWNELPEEIKTINTLVIQKTIENISFSKSFN